MRILTYGLSTDKLAGIETFVLNMNKFMQKEIVFDYIVERQADVPIEKQDTIHRNAIEERGGRILFISPKKKMVQNVLDWVKLLKAERKNSDVVYFNMYSLAWIVPVIIARLMGYRVFVHAHNNNLHNCGMAQKLMHRFCRQLQKVLSITRLTNSKLSSQFFFGAKKAELICNAIDTRRFSYDAEKRAIIRKELNVENKHVYGFAGRIAYQKNPLFLMDVFAAIKKLDKEAGFVVCGDGDMMEETKARAHELGIDVCFVGNRFNVQDYYNAMDVFVLPSRFEGLGLVLIEAQCNGLPCLTSDRVVPQEAKVTDLLDYAALEAGSGCWAKICVEKMNENNSERYKYSTIVSQSNYEIRNEALRLGSLLAGKGGT